MTQSTTSPLTPSQARFTRRRDVSGNVSPTHCEGRTAARTSPIEMTETRWRHLAIASSIAGSLVRILWTFVIHRPAEFVYSDMRGYVLRAERLAAGGPSGPIDTFFPPGTHALLALPIKVFGHGNAGLTGAAWLWCSMSIITVWMSWGLAKELLSPAAAAMTAALCAGWPLFISFGGYFTSETPSMAFLVAALLTGVRASRREGRAAAAGALAAGVLGGIAIATRPQLVLNLLILALAVAVGARRNRVLRIVSLAAGALAIVVLVIALNSAASGRLMGLSSNGGINFWFGHCDARQVTTVNDAGEVTGRWTHAVPNLAGRGRDFVFEGVDTWDDDFFTDEGWACIERDGIGHVRRLARNVVDMTATTMPWPQADDTGWQREVPRAANFVYALLLPWIVIESLVLVVRRRRLGADLGVAFLLANLLCVVLMAILIVGDPRVRTVYDVFGLALLAALLADRFGLDQPSPPEAPEPTEP